ncbi:MAG: PTS fructose transporter subunit IIB [Firmicutes bacterium GWF2_51_9]|nr:MAG: PTS fructose transporter subunit IIB [Firmicutes bacterium GWF2_51_9]OGS59507.1 MAG: PTS fructose transporter subunit IIB [Firmicutes bacterium GWE2_51_13]HAM63451.1 PTS fructose transporter subunit IIB [Erysipelotrichaceae bacterium]HAO61071.1 PTS fructose transporter subunit IIB [Erysipelotrichaceae bacterium]HBZ41132.1 PTS fructose transporter subunit IIB [Erysipelotrichaceae bacterium]
MKIVGVTACPTGIAHTYMAQAALIKKGKELGHQVAIETQGSMGIESELKRSEIRDADIVVLAVGCAVEGLERFEGKKILKIEVSEAIAHPNRVYEKILEIVAKESK